MADRLKDVKARARQRKNQRSSWMSTLNESRKRKATGDAIPCTPPAPMIIQSRTVCFSCGSNDGVEVSHLCTPNLKPVSECKFGRDSMKDEDYQHVLNMLDEDIKHEIVSYIVNKELKGKRKKPITAEEVYKELNAMTTEKVVRKLVSLRRNEVIEEHLDHKREDELKVIIKHLKDRIRYLESREYTNLVNSKQCELQTDAEIGRSFIIEDTNIGNDGIDDYLLETLDIPARVEDDKITADSRHLLYVLVLYCEQCYPKLKMSLKSGYTKKSIKNATSSKDAIELSLENLFVVIAEHVPNVKEAASRGI